MTLQFFSLLTFVVCVVSAEEAEVQVTSLLVEPYMSRSSSGEYEGFIPEILEKIFDGKDGYKISISEDGVYGAKEESGNWNGLVGKLARQETDMAAAPLTVTDQRKEAVTFTKPFMTFNFAALMTKTLQQNRSINSFEDLPKHTDIKYGVLKYGATQAFFRDSKKEPYKKIYEQMNKNRDDSLVRTSDDGVKKVRRAGEHFVFVMESPTAKYIANKSPCDLVVVEGKGEEIKYAFAVKKGDEKLKKKVNEKLAELGDMQDLKDKWWKQDCSSAIRSLSGNLALFSVVYFVRILF